MQGTPANIEPARFEDNRAMLIGGLSQRYTNETSVGIPSQWQSLVPHLGAIARQIGSFVYGVCSDFDGHGGFDYLCGMEISETSSLPAAFSRVQIPAHRYAIFSHRDHISTVRLTWNAIWNEWLPKSGYHAARAPSFERYGEEFNSRTGLGGLEIWLPVESGKEQR